MFIKDPILNISIINDRWQLETVFVCGINRILDVNLHTLETCCGRTPFRGATGSNRDKCGTADNLLPWGPTADIRESIVGYTRAWQYIHHGKTADLYPSDDSYILIMYIIYIYIYS